MIAQAESIDISADEYHQRCELSCSMLKVFIDSPKSYFRRFVAKVAPSCDSPSKRLGRLVHSAILEPKTLERDCVRAPDSALSNSGQRRGKQWDAFLQENEGKQILSPGEYGQVEAMFEAAYSNIDAKKLLLSKGEVEKTILWQAQGANLRSRLDRLPPRYVTDIKTGNFSTDSQFANGPYTSLRYYVQAAFYLDAAMSLDGELRQFAFICIQSSEPYHCFVHCPLDEDIQQGRDEYLAAIEMIRECEKSGDWRHDTEKQVSRRKMAEWNRQKNSF